MPERKKTPRTNTFDDLPDAGFVRQADLVPNRVLPFSAATLWRKVRDGDFPAPLKLGPRITAWHVADVRKWLDSLRAQ